MPHYQTDADGRITPAAAIQLLRDLQTAHEYWQQIGPTTHDSVIDGRRTRRGEALKAAVTVPLPRIPYVVTFLGRIRGAIGTTYRITHTVDAATPQDAMRRLYETHEHITVLNRPVPVSRVTGTHTETGEE